MYIKNIGVIDNSIWILSKENVIEVRKIDITISDTQKNNIHLEMNGFDTIEEIYDKISRILAMAKDQFLITTSGNKGNTVVLDRTSTIDSILENDESTKLELTIIGADPSIAISLTKTFNEVGL